MGWTARIGKRIEKDVLKLPKHIQITLAVLLRDLEQNGPIRGNWPNYGKLARHRHHCHLKKGRPTYVAVWEDSSDNVQIIEIIYAGTHGRAPY